MRRTPSTLYKNLTYLLLCLLLAACDTEKETGFNRAMQNLTAKYNILFNANDIIRQKQQTLALNYVDNYNQLLVVYPDTAARTPTPDKLLESVILRGNTIISEKEQSHYVADGYMLLGKANFMEYNYFNAIEFFNYIIRSYPKSYDLAQEARGWKARAQLHLNQLDVADTTLDSAFIAMDTVGLRKNGFGSVYENVYSTTAQNNETVKKHKFPKSYVADIFATKLQYDIYTEHYADAEQMAKAAVQYTQDIDHRLRWTYILAQLQELNHRPADAVKNYTRVANSNASFEMAFNASLCRIRVEDIQAGEKTTRVQRLRQLLKNENNKEFIDQIYYQIGELYLAQGNIDEAVKNYRLSIRYSLKNQNQKGLSYLRIADINFKNKADYTAAKKYYDSTLTALSPNYPGYITIRKKADNLQLLGDRLQTIAREDTLQMLAKLDDKARAAKIIALASNSLLQQQAAAATAAANKANQNAGVLVNPASNLGLNTMSNFYFYNTAAVAQGYMDFKRIWGNRPSTDNWRISSHANNNTTINPTVAAIVQQNTTASPNQVQQPPANPALTKLQNDLTQNVPLTPAQLTLSNTKIYNAYLDIANFYRDVLEDNKEAINIFELLLKRFPNTVNKPTVYYNLYRLYSDIDPAKSDYYKNLILKDYPDSNFAKVILDPDYNQKLNDKNAAFTAFYTQLFDLVAKRKYDEAIVKSNELIAQFPGSNFLAQVYYLRAIAMGHQQKLDPFKDELKEITDKFPDDKLITPLVKQHQAFIAANEPEIAAREVVLPDDPTEVPFMQQKQAVYPNPYIENSLATAKREPKPVVKVTPPPVKKVEPPVVKPVAKPVKKDSIAVSKPVIKPKPDTIATVKPAIKTKADSLMIAKSPISPQLPDSLANYPKSVKRNDSLLNAPAKPVVEPPSIFSLKDSTNYYFVINVNTTRANMAPSRFGIGQFNRAHIKDNTVRHQLKPTPENQLIYVGRFHSLGDVKAYARSIIPLLPEIMTITADKYNFFIITQQNLDKLADRKTIDSYFDYYQKHY